MPIGAQNRSDYFQEQIAIAHFWIQQAQSQGLNPFVQFSCYYSALNALAWVCSTKTKDGEIFADLKQSLSHLPTFGPKTDFLQTATVMLERIRQEFPDGVHNLASRRNGRHRPEEKKIAAPIADQTFLLSTTLVHQISEAELVYLSIGVIYQFRCNLVHGTKNVFYSGNTNVVDSINDCISHLLELIEVNLV